MLFVQRNHPIQALPSHRPHQTFAIGVRFRRLHRCSQDLQTESFYLRIDALRENRVAIVNEKPVSVLARNRFAELDGF